MLRLSSSQTARLWREASRAWYDTGPHAALMVFRHWNAMALWPMWHRTVIARHRQQYLTAIETASEPRTAKTRGKGRSQYPPPMVGAQRRSGTRQSGHRFPVVRERTHEISTD